MADTVDVGELKVTLVIDEASVRSAKKELEKGGGGGGGGGRRGGGGGKSGDSDADTDKAGDSKSTGGVTQEGSELGRQFGQLFQTLGRLVGIRLGGGVGGTVGAAAGGQAGRAAATGILQAGGIGLAAVGVAAFAIWGLAKSAVAAGKAMHRWVEAASASMMAFSSPLIMSEVNRELTLLSRNMREANILGGAMAEARNNVTRFKDELAGATLPLRTFLAGAWAQLTGDAANLAESFRRLSIGIESRAGGARSLFDTLLGGFDFLGDIHPGVKLSPMYWIARALKAGNEELAKELKNIKDALESLNTTDGIQAANDVMMREVEGMINPPGTSIRNRRGGPPGPRHQPHGRGGQQPLMNLFP